MRSDFCVAAGELTMFRPRDNSAAATASAVPLEQEGRRLAPGRRLGARGFAMALVGCRANVRPLFCDFYKMSGSEKQWLSPKLLRQHIGLNVILD